MNKDELKNGVWHPCIEGGMPEDVLGYEEILGWEITPTVIIPFHILIDGGNGKFYPANRVRKKGCKGWEWLCCYPGKPLFWMNIPELPNTKNNESKKEISKQPINSEKHSSY